MAGFKHNPSIEPAPFKERRTKGRVVPFHPGQTAGLDQATSPVPSPARLLQQSLAQRTRSDLYITDPAERRIALLRFIGTAALLWGGMVAILTVVMVSAS